MIQKDLFAGMVAPKSCFASTTTTTAAQPNSAPEPSKAGTIFDQIKTDEPRGDNNKSFFSTFTLPKPEPI
jgi:hypothetical protein